MPPPLSYGLNLPRKSKAAGGQKRKKTIFDDESDDDGANAGQQNEGGEVEIGTVGGIQEDQSQPEPNPGSPKKKASEEPPPKRKPLFTTKTTLAKKPGPKPLSKNSIFADDDDDDGTNEEQLDSGSLPLGLNASKPKSKPTPKTTDDPSKTYTNLSALHSSKKHAQEAQDIDPTIYSYDAVYDSLHAKPDKAAAADEGGKSSEVPKYMTSLLRSAEVRKRDQLRARDRMLAREREAEGDEFADKEKFVTSAYKAQQEEMRRVEREDAEREQAEEDRRKKQGNVGMVGFYRDMLSRGEERHEEVRKAAEEAAEKIKAGDIPKEGVEADADGDRDGKAKEPSETQRAAELNAQGAHIAVNDEGQVVDKRQLLSAGLNVAPKPKPAPSAAASARKHDPRASGPAAGGRRGETDPRAGQRARQTEMIAAQLEERTRAEAEAEEARQNEIAERNRSRKSEGEVSSAKERYLARKREREQAGK